MAHASMPIQYKRMYKGSLDQDDIFESLEQAEEYAKGPTAYPGHIISALDGGKVKSYIVNDDNTLTEQLRMDELIQMLSWVEISEEEEDTQQKGVEQITTKSGDTIVTKSGDTIIFK